MTGDTPFVPRLVSVVIPTWNRSERLLGAAIESVLAQTVPELELVVVDDGSDVAASPFVDTYGDPVRCHRQDNRGLGAARNAGVHEVTGEFLAFLDSDDVWAPDKLSSQLAALDADPDLEAVFGRAEQFYDEEVDDEYRRRHPIKDPLVDAYLSSAMLIRRTSFDRIGPYDEEHRNGADIDWFLRARENHLRTLMLPATVYHRRLHESNISITESTANQNRLLALKRSLDRRRASGDPSVGGND